jgi:beta-lactamase superfamily II metal-dependent hydrolase
MFFTLDVLRARKGDCLMLHYGTTDEPHLMLIDGGPSNVYGPHLKPRIIRVHEAREIDEGEPLPVDVVLVSHVDDDHIKGILDLTKELRGNSPDIRLDVGSLWHNSFDDLLRTKPDELMVEAGFGTAAVGGDVVDFKVLAGVDDIEKIEVDTVDEHQTLEVLSSVAQGRQLRLDAEELEWKPNKKFRGKLILSSDASKPLTLDGGLKVAVIGPMQPELLALQKAHDEWLKDQKAKKKKTPEAALAAFVDASVANLSSVVLLVEAGGKTMLLTGDARGDKILEGMELVGLLEEGGKTHVDILKVPHHGSQNNMETIFFERVTADHYVFSGNGEHGNPERETLEMLLEARGADAAYTIHLTYPLDETDEAREADWNKEQAKEKKRKKKQPREDWSADKHSLTEFFNANPKLKAKLRIVDKKEPHLINLLEPLKI